MRLDHLLSKENFQSEKGWIVSYGQSDVWLDDFSLFNLEGALRCGDGGLAQLGERLPCKQEVSGSIPLISTTQNGPIAQLARAHD